MGALVFHNAEHRILISGDALWENGYGLIMPREVDPAALPATRATLDMLATLDVGIVIPGHGEPFTDVAAALERAYGRTAAFEADEMRMVRHALKVLLTFTLLDRQRMPLAELPAFVEQVPIFRDFNARYLHREPADLARWLTAALERAGAARCEGDDLFAA
jgi:glyoxylase-like metal-dependent hydrolase (beta-lactamase superfamily II)